MVLRKSYILGDNFNKNDNYQHLVDIRVDTDRFKSSNPTGSCRCVFSKLSDSVIAWRPYYRAITFIFRISLSFLALFCASKMISGVEKLCLKMIHLRVTPVTKSWKFRKLPDLIFRNPH